jgi:hypothetical protein
MRASLAGLLAACALIGIPRLVSELREYRRESQRPPPVTVSVPPESRPAASAAPLPKAPDAAALPKQAPVQLVTLQRDPPLSAGAGTKTASPPSPANEAELIPAIQRELARLGLYDGPVTDKWSRPVRIAARGFLRKTGSRARDPQPTAELLTALKAADPAKKQAEGPHEGVRPEEKPVRQSEPPIKETAPKQSAAAPVPAAENDDYLPPWMTAKTDQARLASKSEAARSDTPADTRSRELAEAPSSFDETQKRQFRRRRHAERPWKGRRRYVNDGGYYSRRRAYFFPF